MNDTPHSQRLQNSPINPDGDHKTIPLWKLLLLTHDHDQSYRPTFEECIELLEYDAEILANGVKPDEVGPIIDYHLALCSPYKEQLEDWLEKLVDHMGNHL